MRYLAVLLLAALMFTGCKSSRDTANAKEKEEEKKPTYIARVLVDGRDKGGAPGTVRIRRSFGEREIEVKAGRTVVRKFEILSTWNSGSTQAVFDLSNHSTPEGFKFDLTDLAQAKDKRYLIPYLSSTIVVQDREYGLTLVIQ